MCSGRRRRLWDEAWEAHVAKAVETSSKEEFEQLVAHANGQGRGEGGGGGGTLLDMRVSDSTQIMHTIYTRAHV